MVWTDIASKRWPMLSPVTLPDSVLTSKLVSQTELAVQRPRLKRDDMEHNGDVGGEELLKLFRDELRSVVGNHLARNTITSKHLS